jgi:uncharacterized protein (TIGR03545 family)
MPPKEKSPPRLQGQTILFTPRLNIPSFWAKRISLSGELVENIPILGQIENVSTQQKIINLPLTFLLQGSKENARVTLQGTLNYLQELARENLAITLEQIPLKNIPLPQNPLLPQSILKGVGSLGTDFELLGALLSVTTSLQGTNLEFQFDDSVADSVKTRINSIYKTVNNVSSSLKLLADENDLSFSATSDLFNALSQNLTDLVADDINAFRSSATDIIENKTEQQKSSLVKSAKENRSQMDESINQREALIAKMSNEIDKTIQGIQKKATGEAGKRLKDLF